MTDSTGYSTTNQPRRQGSTSSGGTAADGEAAYLVLRSAGRWSDVFRLGARHEAVIGRSSSNQISIRSERASRRHARVYWGGVGWRVEDLGSRNGTRVNGEQVTSPRLLDDGDVIEVAGFPITFSRTVDVGPAGGSGEWQGAATDDQITMEMDAASITDRRRQSRYLHGALPSAVSDGARGGASRPLLRLAFALARSDSASGAADAVLEAAQPVLPVSAGGVYVWDASGEPAAANAPPPMATRQVGNRSYRRPPTALVENVLGEAGQAVLARNVAGDRELATENSRGEIDVESVIVAPVRDSGGRVRGMIHLTTAAGQRPFGGEDLEFVVAAAEILGECLANLDDRTRLDRSLKQTKRQVAALQKQLGDRVQIVGRSRAVAEINQQIALAAPTSATILVRGESGVGKELVASAIHYASDRGEGPLVCLNCAALSSTLLESELFGHEKGAFTGATERKRGKFELADGGTLMLDEIGEMSGETQAKFLRVLEGHPFERVGGHEPIRTDVRVVAATNRDLQEMVRAGTFRQDLFYRLHVVEILVPPLRDRGNDCLHLANHFIERFNREMGRKIEGLTEAAQKRLLDYDWPGNIRELKNVIERAVVLNTRNVIDVSDLALAPATGQGHATGRGQTRPAPREEPVELALAELERNHIERVLRHTGGNKSRAAAMLGIERSTLDRKLKRYAQRS